MPIKVVLSIDAAKDFDFSFQEYGPVKEDSKPYFEILNPSGNQFLLLDDKFMSITQNTLSVSLSKEFLGCVANAFGGVYRGSYTVNIGGEIVFFGEASIGFDV